MRPYNSTPCFQNDSEHLKGHQGCPTRLKLARGGCMQPYNSTGMSTAVAEVESQVYMITGSCHTVYSRASIRGRKKSRVNIPLTE
jgi:hypothetical protein